GTDPVAVVTREAAAAGKAPPRLEQGVAAVEAADHLSEGRLPANRIQLGAAGRGRVGVVPGVERIEPGELAGRGGSVLAAGQPGVNVPGRQLAVADRDRDGAFCRNHVTAGE